MRSATVALSLISSLIISSDLESQRNRPLKAEFRDPIATFLQEQGIVAIEFFDSKLSLHMPILSIISCGPKVCSYEIIGDNRNPFIEKYEPTYDSELSKYAPKFKTHIPEYGRLVVSIGAERADPEVPGGRDIVWVTDSILSRYGIVPDTIEISSQPRDSVKIKTNTRWRLLRDSVEFRHVVDVRIIRFVRK